VVAVKVTPMTSNLLGGRVTAARSNAVWVSDITYLRTQEGWLYLAVVLDAFSRRVVGWAMQARISTALTLAALEMACRRRKPPPGLIHHADRGGQYVSGDYREALQTAGMLVSTSGNSTF
jgi:putative transposase